MPPALCHVAQTFVTLRSREEREQKIQTYQYITEDFPFSICATFHLPHPSNNKLNNAVGFPKSFVLFIQYPPDARRKTTYRDFVARADVSRLFTLITAASRPNIFCPEIYEVDHIYILPHISYPEIHEVHLWQV